MIQGSMRSYLETYARLSQSGKDDPLPWFTDGNPNSNTTFYGFSCILLATLWHGTPMPSMIDTLIFEVVFIHFTL